MAGMFYTLEEAVQRLGTTEDEFKAMVEQGKIREFRDGLERLFRVDEVEAVAPQKGSAAPEEAAAIPTAESMPPGPEITSEEEAAVELDIPRPGGADMPSFDIRVELGMLDAEEIGTPEQGGVSEPAITAVFADDSVTDKPLEVRPPMPSQPIPPVPRPAPTAYALLSAPKQSAWQWFVGGLRQDRPAAVIILFVVLGIVLSGCAAAAYFLPKLL